MLAHQKNDKIVFLAFGDEELFEHDQSMQVSVDTASFLTLQVLKRANWNVRMLDEDQTYSTLFILYVASEHVCSLSQSDASVCASAAALELFRWGDNSFFDPLRFRIEKDYKRIVADPELSYQYKNTLSAFEQFLITRDFGKLEIAKTALIGFYMELLAARER